MKIIMKTDFTSVKVLFLTEKKIENFEGGSIHEEKKNWKTRHE